jgi:hypothetical protein
MRSIALLALGVALAFAACDTHDAPTCAAPPASLADCFTGVFFADCGGAGDPRLACTKDHGDCRWFTSTCMPPGYIASTCPATDICCHNNWPFPADDPTLFTDSLFYGIYGLGTSPWNRTREMNVAVTIDPSAPPGDGSLICSGSDPYVMLPCVTTGGIRPVGHIAGTIQLTLLATNLPGWYPMLEIDPSHSIARACAYRFTDAFEAQCPSGDVVCASTGTLTIDHLPTTDPDVMTTHGRLDAALGPAHLIVSF